MKFTPETALAYLLTTAAQYKITELCSQVLGNPAFHRCWGGTTHHHMYNGGLAVHTAEVVQNALNACVCNADLRVLLTAAIWHDYAKVLDYTRHGDVMVNAPYKKLINHVQGSAIEFAVWVKDLDITEEFEVAVTHCILSHHGCKEWGSQVEPQSIEANILHFADMMSMQFGEGK